MANPTVEEAINRFRKWKRGEYFYLGGILGESLSVDCFVIADIYNSMMDVDSSMKNKKKLVKLQNGLVEDFTLCLYDAHCPTCCSKLDWECRFDADGSVYYSDCCGVQWSMYTNTVLISSNPVEE